jgi:hypothetical protein
MERDYRERPFSLSKKPPPVVLLHSAIASRKGTPLLSPLLPFALLRVERKL